MQYELTKLRKRIDIEGIKFEAGYVKG